MKPLRHPRRCLAALVLAVVGTACGADAAPADDRLLVVDGITITLAEVQPYLTFLDSFLPEGGRKAKLLRVLDEHVLPLRLAQRAFPEQRRAALQRAADLCAVAGNAAELDAQSRLLPDRTRRNVTRLHPRLPVAMFLFDPLRVGSVSPPLEVPSGYVVAAAFDLQESALVLDDLADTLQVGFMTHDPTAWAAWLLAERQRVGAAVTHVHPDYREAMPEWLQLPRLP